MSSPLTSPASTEPSPAASAPASDASQARLAASIAADLERALSEDVGSGDLTASLVDATRIAKARVLARPRITTLNGQMASINVGTTDYFQVTTTNTNGVVTSDYRTFNSGITLSITPFVTRSGQITAEMASALERARRNL